MMTEPAATQHQDKKSLPPSIDYLMANPAIDELHSQKRFVSRSIDNLRAKILQPLQIIVSG